MEKTAKAVKRARRGTGKKIAVQDPELRRFEAAQQELRVPHNNLHPAPPVEPEEQQEEKQEESAIPIDACGEYGNCDEESSACIACKDDYAECYEKCLLATSNPALSLALSRTKKEMAKGKKNEPATNGNGNAVRSRAAAPKSKGVNQFGHKLDSQARIIDDLLLQGESTIQEMADLLETTKSRILSHISHLKEKKGLKVESNGKGKYSIILNTTPATNEEQKGEEKVA